MIYKKVPSRIKYLRNTNDGLVVKVGGKEMTLPSKLVDYIEDSLDRPLNNKDKIKLVNASQGVFKIGRKTIDTPFNLQYGILKILNKKNRFGNKKSKKKSKFSKKKKKSKK